MNPTEPLTIRLILIIIIIGCASFMNLNGQNLKEHKWENRILIVSTSDIKSTKYQEQLNEFKNSVEDLIDRKLIVYKVIGDDFEWVDYQNSTLNHSGKIAKKLGLEILNKNAIFEVILIGLDGEIKLQQTEILIKEALFRIIDSMPMRRAELNINKVKN